MVIVSVEVTDEVLLTVTGEGDALQSPLARDGELVQVSVTDPVKPFKGAMVRVEVAEPPGVTVLGLRGLAVKLKSGVVVTVIADADDVELV